MPQRILLTTTSYQDTPGKHHDTLKASGLEVVTARGPLPEAKMLELITKDGAQGGFDGLLEWRRHHHAPKVIDAALTLKSL